jgi:uncharacterized membrane protein
MASAATAFIMVLAMMRRSKTVEEVRQWATAGFIIDKVFPVAVVVLFVTGIWLVEDVGYEYGNGWINVSMITLILMAIAGGAINTRKIGAIKRAADAASPGVIPQVLAAQITDPVLFGTTHALTLGVLAIIWNMTTKPGDAQAGIVVALAVLVGILSAAPMVMRQQAVLEGKR